MNRSEEEFRAALLRYRDERETKVLQTVFAAGFLGFVLGVIGTSFVQWVGK